MGWLGYQGLQSGFVAHSSSPQSQHLEHGRREILYCIILYDIVIYTYIDSTILLSYHIILYKVISYSII